MTSTIQAIAVPVLLNLAYVQPMTFDSRTAVSLVLEGCEQCSTAVFDAQQLNPATSALDWLKFASDALPKAQPLSCEERASVSAFFWSQF